jgi:hypothetical protein
MKFSAEMSELKKVEKSNIEESKTRRRRNGLAAMPPPDIASTSSAVYPIHL